MYEYDLNQRVGTGEFVPRPGGLADFFPEPAPDDTVTRWDLDAEFQYLFEPVVVEAEVAPPQEVPLLTQVVPPPLVPPAAPPATPTSPPAATPPAATPPPVDRRRRRRRLVRLRWPVSLGVSIAAVTGAVASVISVLAAMVSYGPLRLLSSPTAHGLDGLWPLLVYGPWLAGCLTVLHAAAHRRPGRTGWIAVILFSAIAMALCVAGAPRTITGSATAGLPPFSALAGFLLLSRQITLIRPSEPEVPRRRRRKH